MISGPKFGAMPAISLVTRTVGARVVLSMVSRLWPFPPLASQITAADGHAEEPHLPSDSRAARSSGPGGSAEDGKE